MVDQGAESPLVITVVRSGGFAGLRRQWQVEPPAADEPDWESLIGELPWDSVRTDNTSRDRFVWSIEVRISTVTHQATVPERDLTGPWKTLVDRVQSADADDAPVHARSRAAHPRGPGRKDPQP